MYPSSGQERLEAAPIKPRTQAGTDLAENKQLRRVLKLMPGWV